MFSYVRRTCVIHTSCVINPIYCVAKLVLMAKRNRYKYKYFETFDFKYLIKINVFNIHAKTVFN